MKHALTLSLITALLLGGCTTVNNQFNAMMGVHAPQETADYRIAGTGGLAVGVQPGSAERSIYLYSFSVKLLTADSVRSVKVERLNNDGTKTLMIDDSINRTNGDWQAQQPQGARSYLSGKGVGKVTWVGHSPKRNMTKEQAPWLYQAGDTKENYLITITDLNGKVTTFTQPLVITQIAKTTYLRTIEKTPSN